MYLFSGSSNRKLRFSIFCTVTILLAATLPVPSVNAGIPGTPTTTTLVLSAASVASGTVVTLTASVSNGSALTLGTVTFCDATAAFCLNSAIIGTAQLTPAGTAVIKFIPAIGSHSYKAIFSASNGNLASTSIAQPLTVTGLFGTTTSILATGSAGAYTLTGTVVGKGSNSLSPAGGSVSFIDTTNANTVVASGTLGAATLAQAFATRVNYATGTGPELQVTGDFNGDGKIDVAVTNVSDNTVSVFLGNGDGTFQTGVIYFAGVLPYGVATGDFNGDGRLDLAISDLGSNMVTVLLGNGDGTFQDAVMYLVGSAPLTITVGDLNHDGKLDLVVVNDGDSSVSVLLGNGDGSFQAQAVYGTGSPVSAHVLGDFNGDGTLDIAVVDESGNTMSVLLGNGDGTSQSPVPYVVGNGPSAVIAGDFNGDGKLDLATVNSVDNTVSVLLGVGDGTFNAQVTYATGSAPFYGAAADVNGDGIADLVVLNNQAATLSVFIGVGDGTFQTQVAYPTGGDPTGLSIADLNGDGFADLMVVNDADNNVSALLNLITQTASVVVTSVSVSGSGTAHLVDASFAGDDNFAASVSATSALLSTPVSTSLVLTANVGSSTYGQSVTLTATLNPSTAGGQTTTGETITFKIGAVTIGTGTLSNLGVATLTLATLPAGADSLTATYPGDPNFLTNTSSPLSFTVSQAVLTVTASNASRIYGAANPTFTAGITGFVNGDTQVTATTGAPSLTTTATPASPVATYPIVAAIGTLTSTNYSFTFVAGVLTVNQAVLTVTANSLSKTYGAANPALTASANGFVNGDTQLSATAGLPSLTTSATAASPVATYPITAALGTLTSTNYSFTFVPGVLTVSQAILTVTANDTSKSYGAANPVFTASISGFVNGDTQLSATTGAPSLTTTATAASPVATYPITAAIGTLTSTNYSFTFVAGVLTVNQAVLIVTANNLSKTYGAANPIFTAGFSGFVNGDTQATATTGAPSLTTTATAASPVATYPITAALGTLASTNYSFTFINGVLTVTQAVITVAANNVSKVYGAANPILTATFTGFLNGDTQLTATTGVPGLATTATIASVVGSYPIGTTIGTLVSTNYSFTFVNGTFTVNQAVITVTANDASRAYGAANPTFSAVLTGFVNGDTQLTATTGTPSLATTALLTSPVTTYPISAALGTLTATNYSFVFVNGTLTVTQAVLTVTANNASRIFGAANPLFTAAFGGFVNGDTQASATTGTPSLTTPATTASPVGTYPITAAIGSLVSTNYSFTFVNGVLTITQTAAVITWANPAAITFGTALTATQLNATGNTAGSFVYTPVSGTILGAGSQTLSVTFTPTDTTDFSAATATVTLVVNKATPVITWPTPVPILHGTALSGTQLNATASVAGTFVYTPLTGTILAGGSDILSVTFTPTDAVDYTTATATVTLAVSDISIVTNGPATQTIDAGQTASFQVIVAPVGTTTFTSPVTFTITGLPTGATFSSAPTTVPAGSGATAVTFMIQTTFFATTWNKGPEPIAPRVKMLILSAAIFFMMLTMQLFRKRTRLTPQLLAILLLAAPCFAAVVGITGCSSLGANASRTFPLVVTETSGTQHQTVNLILIIQK